MKWLRVLLLFCPLEFLSHPTNAQVFITTQLDSSQSVPVTTSHATGTLWGVLNPSANSLSYQVTYANLDSPFTAAHFHLGAAGTNGGVVEPITFTGNTAQGTWTNIPDSPVDYMLQGKIYINVHSTKYPAGEIREQLRLSPGIGFSMSLDGAQVGFSVPGTGTGNAHISGDSNAFVYRVTIAGLTATLTGAHFQLGEQA